MSVLAEGFSVIVRRSTIENELQGGMETYARLIPNRTFCADKHLTRVGFLDLPTANEFLSRLRAFGLTHHNVDEGPDVGVLHQDEGFLGVVPWLEWHRDKTGRSIAWLVGTSPGELAVPEGWSPDSGLRYIEDAEASSRLIPLENTPNHSAFLDSNSGEVVYGLKSESVAPDPYAHMEIIKEATSELRVVRNGLKMIYVYYFPESWLRVIARSLGFVEQPDFGRYSAELEVFRNGARRILRRSEDAIEAILAADLPPEFKESARLAHRQVFYDGGWVTFFCEYVKMMRGGDPDATNCFREMADYSHKARANLAEAQRAVARLNAKYK